MKKIRVILIGAGHRGIGYTNIMARLDEKFEVVAVAEPIDSRRNYIKEKHKIPDSLCFTDWKPLLYLGKIADVALIATMDREHFEPAMSAINLKYDLLLEKPIAPTAEECLRIAENAKKNNVRVVICTVLRYTKIFIALKDLIDGGRIGRIMSVNHEECVGNIHQSHSFVRGNWGNEDRSSAMLLQKSCHDIDILQWLLGKKCKKVQSFGVLSYFKHENDFENTPEYCIEGCPIGDKCPYNAVKLYLEDKDNWWFRTTCTRHPNPDDEIIRDAITHTQYGKCVYKCDNNVVDHQTVNMLFDDDITVTFTMNAFNKGGRFIHIMGTKGEIRAALDGDAPIELYEFETERVSAIPMTGKDGISNGHAGGDDGLINTLYDYLTDNYNGKSVPDIGESCYNHMITFAAEKSRINGGVTVDTEEFLKESEV